MSRSLSRLGIVWSIASALLLATAACGGTASAPLKPASPSSPPASGTAAPTSGAGAAASQASPAAGLAPTKTDAAAAKPAAGAQQMRFLTTNASSSIYGYAIAMAKVMNAKVPEVNVTVVESGSSIENQNRIARGEAELIISTVDAVYRGYHGIEPWKDKPIKDIRWLWTHSSLPAVFLVREDSGVKKLEDLNGKDFNPGMRGSATENQGRQILEANDVKAKYYVGGTEDAVAAIKDKRIAGFIKSSAGPRGADAAILDLMTSAPMLGLRLTEDQMKKAETKYPWLSRGKVEAGVYKADWNKEAYETFTLLAGIASTTKLSNDLAYKLVKSVVEDNKPGGEGVQVAAFPSIKGFDLAEQTLDGLNAFLHAGAEKYYRELGLKIPEAAKSPES